MWGGESATLILSAVEKYLVLLDPVSHGGRPSLTKIPQQSHPLVVPKRLPFLELSKQSHAFWRVGEVRRL